jgi:hypothetical protein
MGFAFAIDDFGTGFSSLAYLSRFPAGTLKIDISFVRNMLRRPKDYAIVKTIIGMAKSLGLATVADGVGRPNRPGMSRCCTENWVPILPPQSVADMTACTGNITADTRASVRTETDD